MNINRYVFQSPYNSQIQIGRIDTTAQENSSSQTLEDTKTTSKSMPSLDDMATKKAEEVTKIESTNSSLLDTYA